MRPQDPSATSVNAALAKSQLATTQAKLSTAQAELDRLQRLIEVGRGGLDVTERKAQVSVDIAQLQSEIARLTALSIAPPPTKPLIAVPSAPPPLPFYERFDPNIVLGLSFALLACVLLPPSIAFARRIWKGTPRMNVEPQALVARLDHLEQSVDSIAIEVERISEGQRYVTKLIAEQPGRLAIEQKT